MKRVEQRRRRIDSAVPELRSNPFVWHRHKSLRLILIRKSDVTDHIERVLFLSVEHLENFLIEQTLKQKRDEVTEQTDYRKRRGKNWQIKL